MLALAPARPTSASPRTLALPFPCPPAGHAHNVRTRRRDNANPKRQVAGALERTTSLPRRRLRCAGSRPRGRARAQQGTRRRRRTAPWGPEDAATAHPARPDGSRPSPSRPESAKTPAIAAPPAEPPLRTPRAGTARLRPRDFQLTLTWLLSPPVRATTSGLPTAPTPLACSARQKRSPAWKAA